MIPMIPIVQKKAEQMFDEAKSGDEELENYSESVQRRINQLTAKRKQAAEEAQAAVQYAQQMQQENENMKRRLQQMNGAYNNEAENRLKAQEIQATRALQEANEAGDYERVAKAHSKHLPKSLWRKKR